MKQWMLKITAYAERLLEDLEGLDWPEGLLEMQRQWIGRSEGTFDGGGAGGTTVRHDHAEGLGTDARDDGRGRIGLAKRFTGSTVQTARVCGGRRIERSCHLRLVESEARPL